MESLQAEIQFTKINKRNYLLHVTELAADDPEKMWPTILFLHGLGESGDDVATVLEQGLPNYILDKPEFPFIVIAPQCPRFTWWPELADSLQVLLDQSLAALPIDPSRLYLTGLSLGGYGSWYLGALWPEKFAAVAPICGGGIPGHGFPERVLELENTPLWAFHGALDDVVPLEASSQLVELLRESGADVQFTVYPEADHDSWTETYNNPQLYEWFLNNVKA